MRVWLQACLVALIVDLLVFPPDAEAGTITTDTAINWTGADGNNSYSDPGNWFCGGCGAFPNNGGGVTYAATINTGGTDLVHLDANGVIVDSMSLGGSTGSSTLNSGSNSITFGSPTSSGKVLTIGNGGVLNVQNGGSVTLELSAGTSAGNAGQINVTDGGNLTLQNTSPGPATSTITNTGTISLNGTNNVATLTLSDGGQGNSFDFQGNGGLSLKGQALITGGLNNAATMINDSGHTINVYAGSSATISALAAFTNSSAINVGVAVPGSTTAANLTFDTSTGGFLSNTGQISVADGSTLTLSNSLTPGTFFQNEGTITLGTAKGAGLILDSAGSATTFDLFSAAGTGMLNLVGNSTISGKSGFETLVNDVGHTINVGPSGTGSTVSNLSFMNVGTINIGDGTAPASLVIDTSGPGAFSNSVSAFGTGQINVADGAQLVFKNTNSGASGVATFNNDGSVMLGTSNGAALALSGSGTTFDLTSAAQTGTVVMNGVSQIYGATGNESLINDVGHTISNNGTGSISSLAAFTNSGTLTVNAGTLTVETNANLTNWDATSKTLTGGSYSVAAGATLQLSAIGSDVISTLRGANVAIYSNGLLTGNGTTDAIRSVTSVQNSNLSLNGVGSNVAAYILGGPSGSLTITGGVSTPLGSGPASLMLNASNVMVGASGTGALTSSAVNNPGPIGQVCGLPPSSLSGSTLCIQKGSTLQAGAFLNQAAAAAAASARVSVDSTSALSLGSLTTSTSQGAQSSIFITGGTLHVSGNIYQGGGPGSAVPGFSQGSDTTSFQAAKGTVGGNFSNNSAAPISIPGANNSMVEVLSGSTLNVTGTFSQTQGGPGLGSSQLKIDGSNSAVTVGGLTNSSFYTAGFGPQSQVVITNGGTLTVTGTNPDGTSTFTNISSGGMLNGGSYLIGQGSKLIYSGSNDITAIAANTALTLSSTGEILDGNTNALSTLASNAGSLTLMSGATLTTSGDFTNSGSVTIGTGTTLIVDGGSGVFDLQDGGLTGGGTLEATLDQTGGTLNPGDPQSITIDGAYDLYGGTLDLDLAGTNPGQYDRVSALGAVILDGTLAVTIEPGFTPEAGDVWTDVIESNTSAAELIPMQSVDLALDLDFSLVQDTSNPDAFDLVATATPEPGTLSFLLGAMLIACGVMWRERRRRSIQ